MNNLDNVSSEYFPNGATAIENDLILHWYPERIGKRIGKCTSLLELGIGHGFTAPIFQKYCDNHMIIEGSNIVIEQFRKNYPDLPTKLIYDYFENFETKEKFDVIIMGFVLEHVDDPDLILKKYKNYLKPNGRIFIAVPNAKSMNRRLGLELGMIEDIYSLNENDIALGHKRNFCCETLKELIHKNECHVIHEEGIYLKPLPLNILKTVPDFNENLQAMLKVGIDFPELCVSFLMEIKSN